MPVHDPNERRYERLREAARALTTDMENIRAGNGEMTPNVLLGLRLTSISDAAIDAAYAQWGAAIFPWTSICGQARPYVRRFEVAIWINGSLEGLCTGRASNGPDNVTLHYIESRPSGLLQGYVAEIATDAAEEYAALIHRRRVKLKDPVAEKIALYEALGFRKAETYSGSRYYDRIVP